MDVQWISRSSPHGVRLLLLSVLLTWHKELMVNREHLSCSSSVFFLSVTKGLMK